MRQEIPTIEQLLIIDKLKQLTCGDVVRINTKSGTEIIGKVASLGRVRFDQEKMKESFSDTKLLTDWKIGRITLNDERLRIAQITLLLVEVVSGQCYDVPIQYLTKLTAEEVFDFFRQKILSLNE